MSKNTGIAKEVEKLLVDGGMTFEQLKDHLIMDGESTKPLQDALYRLQKAGVIARQDGGLIVMNGEPVGDVKEICWPSDDVNELKFQIEHFNKIIQSLNTEVKSQAVTIARLEDELEAANENVKNFASQIENIKKLNSDMDSVFGAIHNFLDTTGIEANRNGYVLDRIKQLVEKTKSPDLGYIVLVEDNITYAGTFEDAMKEAAIYANLITRGGEILISKTIKIGTIPKKTIEWTE